MRGVKVKKLVYSIPTIYESHSLKLNQLKKHDVDLAHTRSAELLPHIDFIIPQIMWHKITFSLRFIMDFVTRE